MRLRKRAFWGVALVLFSGLLVAQEPKKDNHDGDRPTYSRPELANELCTLQGCLSSADIDTSRMSKAQVAVLDQITANREPNYRDVNAAWLGAEVERFNELRGTRLTEAEVRQAMRFAVINSKSGQWAELKAQLIARTKKRLKKEFANNDAYSSPLDVLYSGKASPSAFTAFLHLAARHAWSPDEYRKQKPVVIFTRGHAMPGLVTHKNGKPTLLGLETAVDGRGVRDFGAIEDLADHAEPVRVVDAETFALLEMFGDKLPERVRTCWTENALREAGDRFKFRSDVIERRVVEATKDLRPEQGPRASGVGFGLAFGPIARTDADRRRESRDTVVVTTVIAPPSALPPVQPGSPQAPGVATHVRSVEELVTMIKNDRSESRLKTLQDNEIKALVDVWINTSLDKWRENKEERNLEVGSRLQDFATHQLSPNTTATVHWWVTSKTVVPDAAKTASQAVHDARVRVENKAKDALKATPLVSTSDVLGIAAREGLNASNVEAGRRQAMLTDGIGRGLEDKGVTGQPKAELLPLLVDLELKRIEAKTVWARVPRPTIPMPTPKKDDAPAKKDGPPAKK